MRPFALLLAITVSLLPLLSFAQNRTITGTVTDQSGAPLALVSVVEKGTTNGAATDERGQFRLTTTGARPVLVFSYTGLQTQEVAVGSSNTYSVSMRADGGQMTEVVVTALGIRREKKQVGYSTVELDVADVAQTRQPNIVNAMQGRATGLQINAGGGAPGQGARIVMRGITSLDPNRPFQPLFVVDGIPIDNATDVPKGSTHDLRGMTNRAADINPDDIQSITILKGGAATALYGLRASTGAIIITTKSGRAGKVRASVSSTFGIEEVNKFPDVQKTFTQGFGTYDKASFWPSWGPTVAEAKAIDPSHPDELFNNYERGYEQGSFFRNTVNLSGGSEVATFAASLSQYNHDGVLPFSDYKNYSAKISGELKASSKLRVGASANFINSGGYRVNADRYNEQLSYWAPRWDVRDYITPEGTMKSYGPENDNPWYVVSQRRFKDDVNRLIGNINLTYTPLNWLELTYRFGGDVISDARSEHAPGPKGIAGEFYPGSDFRNFVRARGLGGFVEEYRNNRRILNSTAIIGLNHKFSEDLSTSLKLGHDLYDSRVKYVYTIGDTLSDPYFFNLNNTRRLTASNYLQDYRIVGAFADLTLGWKEFLFLTLTGRNDWTSTLPKENRSFFYPSASLSYIASQHLNVPDWISYLKLRGSAAKIGKDALPYSFSAGFIPLTPPFQGGLTLADRSGDPALKPEFTTSYEAGVDVNFLTNRLGLEFTYYNNTSKDLIIPVAVTTSSGLNELYLNAGTIRNKGIELSVTGAPFRSRDFNWDIRVNYTRNNNKVVEIYPGLTEVPIVSQFGYLSSNVTQKFIPGMPVGALFGRSYNRYYGSDKEDATFIDYNRPLLIGSNGFPSVNTKQMYLGKTQPDWIGSLYNELRYKQFGLSFLFDTQQGLVKYNQMSNFMSAFGIAPYTTNRRDMIVFEGVTANGQPNTKQVFLGMGTGPDNVNYGNGFYRNIHRGVSENFIEDASFIKLRTLTLSYQLPASLVSRTKVLSGVNIALTGNNLWLHTDYAGFDPESSSMSSGSIADGFAGFTYPAVRSYLATLNLSF